MTVRTSDVARPFVLERRRLSPDRQEAAPTESEAIKRAAAMAARLPGAAALRIVADDETGEFESVTIPGQRGGIPDDLAEGLRGG